MPQQNHSMPENPLLHPFRWCVLCAIWFLFLAISFYGLTASAAVATIHVVGGACGATIQACINSAQAGDTVMVPADTYAENLVLNKPVSLIGAERNSTIVRSGRADRHVLIVRGAQISHSVIISGLTFMEGRGTVSGRGISLEARASPRLENLVIRDNRLTGLYLAAGSLPRLENLLIRDNNLDGIRAEGDLTLVNAQIISNTGGGIQATGQIILIGGEVSRNQNGGVYTPADVVVTNTRFLHNELQGAIVADVLTATGALVEGNQSQDIGGGIFGRIITLTNTQVFSNFATSEGGGIYAREFAFLYNCDFVRNRADAGGGGASVQSEAVVENTRFRENRSGYFGGGIDADSLVITNSQFIANIARLAGGGVNTNNSRIVRSHFERNRVVDGHGGGVWSYYDQPTNIISASTFLSNTASGNFGGAASYDVINSRFQGNRAGVDYGGAFARGSITGSQFINNQAGNDIGGGGANQIVDSQFQNNRASGNGGGAAVYMVTLLHGQTRPGRVTNSTFQNNRAVNGGGLYTGFGEVGLYEVKLIENQANQGGGFFVEGCDAQCLHPIENTLFAGNVATNTGSAIYYTDGNLSIRNSTFAAATLNPKPAIYYYAFCGIRRDLDEPFCTGMSLNNSIIANHSVGVQLDPPVGPGKERAEPDYSLDYDLFFAVGKPISITKPIELGSHRQNGDPLFVDPAQHNYNLHPNSPAIDRANANDCPVIDIAGRSRPAGLGCDIGAYEAGAVGPGDGTLDGGRVYLPLVKR